ncbi:hypothetical protein LLY41_02680 [Cytobacillus firmus]|uniref:hypothetical protein n=1 Tax=Cytobacillus firmus TaxID=1399 RepID=UPI00218B97C8|nr:hypothetical protein [Cytobacillus firmus]URM33407.1 hypothetical protein LLY41_02680 [Cytobacillus firmus]
MPIAFDSKAEAASSVETEIYSVKASKEAPLWTDTSSKKKYLGKTKREKRSRFFNLLMASTK